MSYPQAAGTPSHSGVYIPEIWSGELLEKFYEATVLAAISNTDYEGEIREKGDTVYITTVPDITVRDYTAGQNLNYENPEGDVIPLLIDKGKYWGFKAGDVLKKQSHLPFVSAWGRDASEQLKNAIDVQVLGDVYADAHAYNSGATAGKESGNINLGVTGTPLQLSKVNMIDKIVEIGQVLDEQSVPDEGRWIVIPAWGRTRILTSELKDASLTGDGKSMLRNGRLGMIDRFEVFSSNNLTKVTDASYGGKVWQCIAGHRSALTFASQITENETLKNPHDFGDLVRGLQVYGYKVVQAKSLVNFYCAPV